MRSVAAALAACHAGRVCRPDDAELLVLEGDLQRQQGNNAAAEQIWRHLTEPTPARAVADPDGTARGVRFGSAAEGLGGRQARHRLALLYRAQGRADEAEAQWQGALAEDRAFLPAWLGLGELYLAAGRWPELERVVHELGNGLQRAADAQLLHARALLVRREYDAARELLEDLIARDPRAAAPHVYLSHIYLQQAEAAGDRRSSWWDAAEQILRTVVRLDPHQASSWRNLALLLGHERGRPTEALAACRAGRFHCPDDAALVRLEEQLARSVV
jgi:tetratricopeptide (TPR) repeat protein